MWNGGFKMRKTYILYGHYYRNKTEWIVCYGVFSNKTNLLKKKQELEKNFVTDGITQAYFNYESTELDSEGAFIFK